MVVACGGEGGAGQDPFANSAGSGAAGTPLTSGANGGSSGVPAGQGGASSGSATEGNPPVGGIAGQSTGGAAGSGGAPNSAGASGAAGIGGTANGGGAGTSGAGSGGTGAVTGASCEGSGVFLCDDFESAVAGQFPSAPTWDPNSCTSHAVDGTVAHTGSQSLRGGAEQYPACMAHADISDQTEVYARSWIRLGAASSDSGHEIGVLEFGPTLADNPELRVGFRNNDSVCVQAPGVEVTVDGVAGGERTTCSGVALEANRWYCLQVHFTRAPGSIGFSVQIDGSSVVPDTTYSDAVAAWSDGPMFLKLGRSSYGGNNVWPVWHDDVVLSTQPVGCDP